MHSPQATRSSSSWSVPRNRPDWPLPAEGTPPDVRRERGAVCGRRSAKSEQSGGAGNRTLKGGISQHGDAARLSSVGFENPSPFEGSGPPREYRPVPPNRPRSSERARRVARRRTRPPCRERTARRQGAEHDLAHEVLAPGVVVVHDERLLVREGRPSVALDHARREEATARPRDPRAEQTRTRNRDCDDSGERRGDESRIHRATLSSRRQPMPFFFRVSAPSNCSRSRPPHAAISIASDAKTPVRANACMVEVSLTETWCAPPFKTPATPRLWRQNPVKSSTAPPTVRPRASAGRRRTGPTRWARESAARRPRPQD
jgi:hypothetical protein